MRIFAKYPSLWFQTVILLKEHFIMAWNHFKNYSYESNLWKQKRTFFSQKFKKQEPKLAWQV